MSGRKKEGGKKEMKERRGRFKVLPRAPVGRSIS